MPTRFVQWRWYRDNWVIVLTCLALIAPIAYTLFDRSIPVTLIDGNVEPPEPRQGGTLLVDWTAIATKNCAGTVRRHIIDSSGVLWDFDVVPAIAEAFTPPRVYHLVREVFLPPGISVGKARYYSELTFYCNFSQWFIWPLRAHTPTVEFTILPAIPSAYMRGERGETGKTGEQGKTGETGATGTPGRSYMRDGPPPR